MRQALIGILGLVAAAGVAWWLMADTPTTPPVGPVAEDDAPALEAHEGPALEGSGDQAPSKARANEGRYVITVRVLDEKDNPLAGVPLELRRTSQRWPGRGYAAVLETNALSVRNRASALLSGTDRQSEHVADAESDASGRFTFRVDEARYHTVYARPALPAAGGYASAHLIGDIVPTVDVTLRVYAGVSLQGRVEDAAGKPVAAKVQASHKRAWSEATDSEVSGTFRFAAVPEKPLSLRVTLPSGRQYTGFTAKAPFQEPVVLRLPGGSGSIAGTVRTPEDVAIAGAFVVVQVTLPGDDPKKRPKVEFAARSDAEGRFGFDGLPAGEITQTRAVADGFLAESRYAGSAGFVAIPLQAEGATVVDLVLRRGSAIHGRVTQKDTEAPIEGATVTLYFKGFVPPQTSVQTTDAEGLYRFDGVGDGKFMLLASHPGYYAPEIEAGIAAGYNDNTTPPHLLAHFTKTDQTVERDLALARGTTLSGVVLDPDGKPAGNTRIYLQRHGLYAVNQQWRLHFHGDEEPAVVSKDDGTFVIEGLAPRPDWVLLGRKVGYAALYTDPVALNDGPVSDVVVRLERQCIVRGHVLDANGKGMANQLIYVSGFSTLRGGDWKFQTQEDGSFELHSLPAAKLNLSTSHEQLSVAAKIEDLTVGEIREGVTLQYGNQVTITGTVRTSAGEPVPDLRVLATRQDGLQEHRETRTDANGAFKIENVSPGRVRLSVAFDNHSREDVTETFEAPARDVVVTLDPPAEVTVSGTVVGPDGKPIPAFAVYATSKDHKQTREKQFTNGTFQLTLRGKPPFSITAVKPRAADGTPMDVQPGWVSVADPSQGASIRLEAGVSVAGHVLDKEGKGIVNVQVDVMGRRTRTDIHGAWRLTGLRPGRLGVTVRPPKGFIPPEPVIAEPGDEDIEFRLEQGTSISGRVTFPKGAKPNGGRVRAHWGRHGTYGPGQASGVFRASGAFTVSGIPPHAVVTLYVAAHQVPDVEVFLAPASLPGVKAGRTDVEIELSTGVELSGTVVHADGTPLVDGGVSLQQRGVGARGYGQTKPDGSFVVRGLQPGTYDLFVFKANKMISIPSKITVPASDVRIVLPERGEISGRLIGAPKDERWVVVAVDPKTGASAGMPQANVGSDGTWVVGAVDKGRPWVLVARRDDGASDRYGRSDPVQVGDKDIEIKLQTGVSLSGRLERDGKGLPQAYVSATGPGWSSGTISDGEGNFTLRGMPPGRYKLRANSWSLGITGEQGNVATGSTGVVIELGLTDGN